MSYFIFNNIDSRNITGLIVTSLPPIAKPPKKVDTMEIDGRDGDIIIEQGYRAYDKKIEIGLTSGYDIDEIISWLDGSGDLIMSSEEDKIYKARIIGQINFERLLKFKTAEITFHVQPYKYLVDEAKINASSAQITAQSVSITNEGNVSAKPAIKLTGSGTVNISLNGYSVFSYEFPANDTYVIIDSEEQDAYVTGALRNRYMNGDFPVLNTGSNTLTWTGTLTAIEITPRSRWL